MSEDAVKHARERVQRLRGFYVHIAVYVVVISGLALIDWITAPSDWWVQWPMVGWGIGLAAHGVAMLFESSLLGPEWEERKTQELLERSNSRVR
jgi:hypothetical protein